MSIGQTRTDVLLLRDVPEQGLLSMERYADALQRGFEAHPRVRLAATAVHASARGSTFGRVDGYAARYLRYPLAAARSRAGVYHIVDQGYAHLAAVLPRGRTIITCHDLMLLRAHEGAAGFTPGGASLLRFRLAASFLRRVARVICDSETTRNDMFRLLRVIPERTAVVYPGIDERFRPYTPDERQRVRAALPSVRGRALLHVSSGDAYKNAEGTLRVLAALRRTDTGVTLVRAGRPLDQAQRALARRLGIEDSVADLGRVSDDRLVELYNACDVLIFPSFYEGFGWPPLEAMACGTPVVTSDAPALVETCGAAAMSAPADDIEALAAAVRAVFETPELAATLRARGLERVRRFTWRRAIDDLADIYEGVAARANAPGTGGDRVCAA